MDETPNEIQNEMPKEDPKLEEIKKKLQEKEKKELERKQKLSASRKKTAITKNKDLNLLKKKGELFDKYLNNQLSYEDILKNGFEFKKQEQEKHPEKAPEKKISRTQFFREMLL